MIIAIECCITVDFIPNSDCKTIKIPDQCIPGNCSAEYRVFCVGLGKMLFLVCSM